MNCQQTAKAVAMIHELEKRNLKALSCIATAIAKQFANCIRASARYLINSWEQEQYEASELTKNKQDELMAHECDFKEVCDLPRAITMKYCKFAKSDYDDSSSCKVQPTAVLFLQWAMNARKVVRCDQTEFCKIAESNCIKISEYHKQSWCIPRTYNCNYDDAMCLQEQIRWTS